MYKLFSSFVLFCFSVSLFAQTGVKKDAAAKPVSHALWTAYLQKHVSPAGTVHYNEMKNDIEPLKAYLKFLSDNHPAPSWTKNELKAYWINVYNAFTIQLILEHYPVHSIRDIGAKLQSANLHNTVWDIDFISIENTSYDLQDVEHKILRKLGDPRIHFAIVCAAVSCPALRNEAYEADMIEAQLADQTKKFINDKSKNDIQPSKAALSKMFDWFAGDFKSEGGVINFINTYSVTKIQPKAEITYLKFNWDLNE